MSNGQTKHNVPKMCSFNIPIQQVSCGSRHTAFITTNTLCYTMGNNQLGQLGINEPCIDRRNSPVLVDCLLNYKPTSVSCGIDYTVVLSESGDCFAWGTNLNGQCGTKGGNSIIIHYTP